MLALSPEERDWLDAYRLAWGGQCSDLIEEILVFGSKARGDAGPDSDLDVLVILREGDRSRKREIRHIGHGLAVLSDVVPSIMVYTLEEWASRKRGSSPFYSAVMRDGVRVA